MAQVQIDTEILDTIGKIEPEHSLDRSVLRLLEKEVVRKITKYRFIIYGFEKNIAQLLISLK
ncbi:MAG: hypothetical protein U9R02_02670 [Thermodesulfobacteriota bacterium]|nr:hypothetical protein [Thermodesulfobacteriota bacterium]